MKKALVLGIGNAQVDLIRYLKKTGWWVIGCGYRQEGMGLKYIDQFELMNITNTVGVENLARTNKVDLIYSIGSDLAMPTIAKVAPKLGLPTFVDYETASLLQNKVLFREFLTARNISPVQYCSVRTRNDLDGWDCFPAIVKPSDNQGQRGVFLAESMQDIETRFKSALDLSRSGTLIVEEYLAGSEISINAFVCGGKVIFSEVSDRLVVDGYAGGIPKSHVLPTKTCFGDFLIETKDLVTRCIQAFSIENGPVYFQVKLTSLGPKIIEMTPRLDGCHVWRLIKSVGNVDLLESSVKLLTGDKLDHLVMNENLINSHLNFFLIPLGKVFNLKDYPLPENASYCEYYYNDGDIVRPINGYLEKVGYYIETE